MNTPDENMRILKLSNMKLREVRYVVTQYDDSIVVNSMCDDIEALMDKIRKEIDES